MFFRTLRKPSVREILSCRRCAWAVIGGLVLMLPLSGAGQTPRPAATRPSPNPQSLSLEYQKRFDQLAPNDVQGHYELAEWCRDHKLYRQLLKQSLYVLNLDPGHENARLLYRLAVDQLKSQNAQSRPADGNPPSESAEGEFLTPAQIQRLRWAEFLEAAGPISSSVTEGATGGTSRARARARVLRGRAEFGSASGRTLEESFKVRFDGKVLDEFLDLMSGYPDFSSRQDRTAFLTLPTTRQVQLIRQYTGNKFENRVEIVTDPLVFRQFQRILPTVTASCGSLTCHGAPDAQPWRLRVALARTEQNLYTNFLILNRARIGNQRLVNREKPDQSLLLQYGLPPDQAVYHHPEPIPVSFLDGTDDTRYRMIYAWVELLRVPEPRTGISLPGYPERALPEFGGTPKEKGKGEAPDAGP